MLKRSLSFALALCGSLAGVSGTASAEETAVVDLAGFFEERLALAAPGTLPLSASRVPVPQARPELRTAERADEQPLERRGAVRQVGPAFFPDN